MSLTLKYIGIIVILTIFTNNLLECAPASDKEFLRFLVANGYTAGKSIEKLTASLKKEAIKKFKKDAGLPITDKINAKAKQIAQMPRCGRPNSFQDLSKPAELNTRIWNKRNLTYRFKNYPRNGLEKSLVIKEIEKSFSVWAEQINISFELIERGDADIDITFIPPEEGDGKGQTLAYAYFPTVGDAYFDDENWTIGTSKGHNLMQVAAHEFGHSLGLEHSDNENALMFAFMSRFSGNLHLHEDDIFRIQKLYGKKSTPVVKKDPNQSCVLEKMDNILTFPSNIIYVLKNDQCWKFKNEKLEKGYPKHISDEWPSNYYIYKQTTWPIAVGTVPVVIDAAFVMDGNLYVFKDDDHFKYEVKTSKRDTSRMHHSYHYWLGVPSSVDAAYYDGSNYVYFFKNKEFFKFDKTKQGVRSYTAVKQPISEWFGCKVTN